MEALNIGDRIHFRDFHLKMEAILTDAFDDDVTVSLFAEGRNVIRTYELGENSIVKLREPDGDFWQINVYSIQPLRKQAKVRVFYRHKPARPAPSPEPLKPFKQGQGQQQVTTQPGVGQGWTLARNMRRGDEIGYGGIRVRLIRVDANSVQDDYDDTVTLIVNTNTRSVELRLGEFRSDWIEDYRITAERIDPSGSPGSGRAVIRISYEPPH
jgi:hypothetical protein